MYEMLTVPYTPADGSFVPVTRVQADVYPAGDAYFRPKDMIRFLGAHLNGGTGSTERTVLV
jgi:hypothetical protein